MSDSFEQRNFTFAFQNPSYMQSTVTTAETHDYLVQKLSKIYDEGEAKSVAKILFEDAFNVKNPSENSFMELSHLPKFDKYLKKLLKHEPLQYVLGQADFYGLKFYVNPSVLIPRQETEELVVAVKEYAKSIDNQSVIKILDIGTGSGCIPVSLFKNLENCEITAIDVSEDALKIASKNAKANKADIQFKKLDFLNDGLWNELGKFDIIISNPPYVLQKEISLMPQRVHEFEPHIALFVDDDKGLIFYEKISAFAQNHLNEAGAVFLECNEFNASTVLDLYKDAGFKNTELRKDISGKDRLVIAQV